MEDQECMNDSFSEVKICKPVPVRLCQNSKKTLKGSLSSSTSTVNSEINMNSFNAEETKISLENIPMEEIDNDFFLFKDNLEEEECHNELYDIMNGFSSEKDKGAKTKNNIPKIERCKKEINTDIDMFKSSFFDDMIDQLNELNKNENNENKQMY